VIQVNQYYSYVLAVLSSFVFSLFLTKTAIFAAGRFNIKHVPTKEKNQDRKISDIGGIPVLLALLVGMIIAYLIYPEGFIDYKKPLIGIGLGTLIIMIMGFWDDRKELHPGIKFAIQIVASLIVVAFGVKISLISNPFNSTFELGILAIPVTVLWVVSVTNAINLVDGMDGLAPGVLGIAGISLFTICAVKGFPLLGIISLAMAGATFGFLRFNYPPASIILGNVGAYSLGFIIATASIIQPVKASTIVVLFVPMLALGFPVLEISITVVRRLMKRKRIYQGDTEHLHHLLLNLGLPPNIVDWVFYTISILFGTIAVGFSLGDRGYMIAFLIVLMLAFLVLALKLEATKQKRGRI